MEKSVSTLTEAAWAARFWACYHILPEELKEGFAGLARGLVRRREAKGAAAAPLPGARPGAETPAFPGGAGG